MLAFSSPAPIQTHRWSPKQSVRAWWSKGWLHKMREIQISKDHSQKLTQKEKGERKSYLHAECNRRLNMISFFQHNDVSVWFSFSNIQCLNSHNREWLAVNHPNSLTGSLWASQEHCLRDRWVGWGLQAATAQDSQCSHPGKRLEDGRWNGQFKGRVTMTNQPTNTRLLGSLNYSLYTPIPLQGGATQLDFPLLSLRAIGKTMVNLPSSKQEVKEHMSSGSTWTPGTGTSHLCSLDANWSYKGISHYHFVSPSTEKP